ncbi:hypothetical protein [Mitsuaria sp. GD03876]|uniref:hypothetical protein n=1 Tax=Mitsuaria sp. GD03876 TaxID=2975399 RepID=UPI00244D6484|nr:hypothetical protein [Mitsuaria sp. GD03876]MDH0867785.1 hypothetical protein [Mitsuaria sp. GD03876]
MNSPVGPIAPIPSVGAVGTATPPVHDQVKALQRHLAQCAQARGRWFAVALFAERIHGMVLPRLATTAALSAVTLGLFAHWL